MTDPSPCGSCGNFIRVYQDFKAHPPLTLHNVCTKYSVQKAVAAKHCPVFVPDMRQKQLEMK